MISVSVDISKTDYDKLNQLIDEGLFKSTDEFINDAVKKKLENFEDITKRKISKKEAMEEIHNYCKEKGKFSVLDITQDLELDVFFVLDVVDKLMDEGVVEEVEF